MSNTQVMPANQRFTAMVGDKEFVLETGKLAEQAGGAVTVRLGDTVVFATATMSATPREGIDFFPLSVDYEEKLYAAGRIPGSFFRREGRPAESGILISRLVDRRRFKVVRGGVHSTNRRFQKMGYWKVVRFFVRTAFRGGRAGYYRDPMHRAYWEMS